MSARDRGEWIPWYCETSPGWAELSFAARGVAEGIARLMGRSRGEIHLGSRGLRGLCLLLHGRWEEFEPAMRELLSPGPNGEPPRLVLSDDHRVLIDPEHESRRRPTSTSRVHRHRAKSDPGETHETVSPVSSEPETGACVSSPLLSSDLISSSEKGEPERGATLDDPLPDRWRADAEGQVAPTGETVDVDDQWRRYLADRLRPEQPKRVSLADWRGWILKAIKYARDDRMKASDQRERQRQRDAQFANRFKDHTPKYEQPTRGQSKSVHEELVRRLAEENAKKGAA